MHFMIDQCLLSFLKTLYVIFVINICFFNINIACCCNWLFTTSCMLLFCKRFMSSLSQPLLFCHLQSFSSCCYHFFCRCIIKIILQIAEIKFPYLSCMFSVCFQRIFELLIKLNKKSSERTSLFCDYFYYMSFYLILVLFFFHLSVFVGFLDHILFLVWFTKSPVPYLSFGTIFIVSLVSRSHFLPLVCVILHRFAF